MKGHGEGCDGRHLAGNPCNPPEYGRSAAVRNGVTDEDQRMIDALKDWWLDTAAKEVEPVASKAVEYGPNSMIEVGRAMGRMSQRDLTDEEAIEVACMFYISGKLGRWVDAVAHGKRPSDDTIHDIGIYIKMTQRNRDVGGWPFAPEEK